MSVSDALPDLELSTPTADEIPFIYDSWIKNWRTSRFAGCIPNNKFHGYTRDAINELVLRGAHLMVARRLGRVLGWVCYEAREGRLVVHSAYVKSAYRGYPILPRLIEEAESRAHAEAPGFYTYRTDYLTEALAGLGKGTWSHAPEIARRKG